MLHNLRPEQHLADPKSNLRTVAEKYAVRVCVVLTVSIGLGVVICRPSIAQKQRPQVSVHETFVQIHPGTRISGDDQRALDAVLKHYGGSLYQLRTYNHGKVVRTQGKLKDARIDQTLVAEVNEAALRGVSYVAVQIGRANSPRQTPTPVTGPTSPTDNYTSKVHIPTPAPNTAGKLPMEAREMVNRVAPILQKYSQ